MVKKSDEHANIAGVEISNPHKHLYPDLEFTKTDLASYYEKVIDRMLPLVSFYIYF